MSKRRNWCRARTRGLVGAAIVLTWLAGFTSALAEERSWTLVPGDDGGRRLQVALERYRAIAKDGGWPTVPDGPTLRSGDSGASVAALRRRLAVTGDLGRASDSSDQFDSALDAAVRRFQHRHGLGVDGLVGPKTRAALNESVEARIAALAVNLARARRTPRDLPDRYVVINLPAFELFAVADRRTVLAMRVIVGTTRLATPKLAARITEVVFNPYWVVPQSIARKELLPVIRSDVGFLARSGFTVFDGWDAGARALSPTNIDWSRLTAGTMRYRLRQDPGPLNPLGRIKFVLADSGGIYLHDTPLRGAFERPIRALSHGCIRLERPLDLAVFALAGAADWSLADIVAAEKAGERRAVRLARPLAVYTVYRTAWVDGDGAVQFRGDIYGQDSKERLRWRTVGTDACAAE